MVCRRRHPGRLREPGRKWLLDERPWLVVSGINRGANLGEDISYSGTVSAAMEALLLGIPGVAFSQVGSGVFDYDIAGSFATSLVNCLRREGVPQDTVLNVNVPEGAGGSGFAVTRQGKRCYGDAIVEKVDPRGRKYYWIGGGDVGFEDQEGSDFAAIAAGLISVTPLHLDFTNYQSIRAVGAMDIAWP